MRKTKGERKLTTELGYEKRRELSSLIFIIPFIIGFLMFFLYPLFRTFHLSFLKQDTYGNSYKFIGTENYKILFSSFNYKTPDGKDLSFVRILTESLIMVAIELPFITIFSLIIAIILNQKFRGRGIARTIFLLPIIFGSGIVAKLMQLNNTTDFHARVIAGQNLYKAFDLDFLFSSQIMPSSVVATLKNYVAKVFAIISFSGVQILIFLSALQSINPTLYEVAKIEGASAYESFWRITLPSIMPVMITTVIYTFVEILYRSPLSQVMIAKYTDPHPSGGIGITSAMAVIFLLITMALLVVIVGVLKGIQRDGQKEKKCVK